MKNKIFAFLILVSSLSGASFAQNAENGAVPTDANMDKTSSDYVNGSTTYNQDIDAESNEENNVSETNSVNENVL